MSNKAAIEAWKSYKGAPIAVRGFLLARIAAVPIEPITKQFADVSGTLLSVGSGHGLVERAISIENPTLAIRGFELDVARVDLARRTQARAPKVEILCADVTKLDETDVFQAALACDLFHHLDTHGQEVMAAELARRVVPGGKLVVKDIARTPRWKHRWNSVHDRIVAGEKVNCLEPSAMTQLLERNGFRVASSTRLQPASPYPHYLVAAFRTTE